jgi:hypothetical protein
VTAWSQVRALVSLRWSLVRSPVVRAGLVAVLIAVPVLAALVLSVRGDVDPDALVATIDAAPAAFLGFGALAIIAPLTSSAATELFPSSELVAFPVRPGTQFLSSLMLAPLNLVWIVQLLVLTAETGFLSVGQPHLGQALLTSACFVVAATAIGQALAWTAVGLRCTARGRMGLRVALGITIVTAIGIMRSGHGRDTVDHSYAPWLVRAVRAGARGDLAVWLPDTAVLLVLGICSLYAGSRLCRWAVRIPQDRAGARDSRAHHRRRQPSDDYRALVTTDRASVWRAPALRRGAIVLAVLPGVAAAGVGLPWRSLVFLPGLVAAGGGLLFGFNAFCLDATGAVWLASLPHAPHLVARSKTRVTAEAVLLGSVLAAVIGAVRAKGSPTLTEVVAILASTATCAILVVALCLSSALQRPHRADLIGPRDAIAPPGALVLASLKLAVPTAVIGGALEASAAAPDWWVPLTIAVPVAALSAVWIATSLQAYNDPLRRSRIVQTVSAG